MQYEKYLNKSKIELLKQNVKLSIRIKLKTLLYELIDENQLRKT